ncbi:MAG: circadian clock KaiB family protein, partial [Pseudolabrys sp.]
YDLEIIDAYQQAELVRDEQIVVLPTLIKELPFPLRRMVGDLSDEDKVLVTRADDASKPAHSSPHFFDGIKESGDHGGGFEKNRGVSADGRFLRIHPDDSPAPR